MSTTSATTWTQTQLQIQLSRRTQRFGSHRWSTYKRLKAEQLRPQNPLLPPHRGCHCLGEEEALSLALI